MINNYSELIKKLPRKYSTHIYYNTSFSMNLRSKINAVMSIRFKSVFICKIKVKNNIIAMQDQQLCKLSCKLSKSCVLFTS